MKQANRPSSVSIAFDQSMISIQKNEVVKKTAPSGYTIKLANTLEEREAAYRLAYKIYLGKGYIKENSDQWLVKKQDANSETATLIVQDLDKKVVGTVTMLFDGVDSVPAENIYAQEIKQLRLHQEKIVEISRLAIDNDHRKAKEILILLFNYLYIFSAKVKKYTCLTIEVNPRHKEYYRTLLCFDEIGDIKPCPNVQDAPAVLMYISLQRSVSEVLNDLNSNPNKKNRSIFPYFLKPELENLVAYYLEKQYKPMSEEEKVYFGFTESGIGKIVKV